MRKHLLLPLIATMVLLAACGSDSDVVADDDPVDTTTTTPPADNTEPEPSDEPNDEPPLGGGSLPVATFDVTITHPDADDLRYTISCLGDTATITPAVAGLNDLKACERLGDPAVRARLIDGPPADQVCTEQYGGPDVARIIGSYDGVDGIPVDATIDRTNGCGIFDWDDLLAGVLPKPRPFE